jgi:soluble lytic murein transglycosylase-like protein
MRIDFAARYREVANLLNASTKPATEHVADEAFEQDLGSLLSQPTETTDPLTPKVQSKPISYEPRQSLPDPMEGLRASMRWNDESLQTPSVKPLAPPEQLYTEAPAGLPSVKTPTVHEVKRVEVPQIATSGVPQLGKEQIRERLVSVSQTVGIDPALAQAVVSAESSFNVKAVSNDGHASKGLFQLLDTTGRDLLSKTDMAATDYNPFNPDLNMKLGTSYLKYLHDIFRVPTALPQGLKTKAAANDESLEKLAVAAFNAGEGRVASAQNRTERSGKDPAYYDQVEPFLPRTTRDYVTRVLEGKKLF